MALVLLVLFWFQSALWQCTRICTAKNTDTLQEGQGTVLLLFLQQLFFVIPVHHSEDNCINQLHDFTLISELEHWSF